MAFVLDASVAGCWAFDDEEHPAASAAFERIASEPALVPGVWWFEIRNLLIVNERRGRITEAETAAFLGHLGRLPITADFDADGVRVLELARRARLSVYDAAYLELAQRLAAPLATLDAPLARAAKEQGVGLVE
jgi:predicted nucleic acid-binding protein